MCEVFPGTISEVLLPTRMAKMENTDHTECWQGCGGTEFSHMLLGKFEMVQHLGKELSVLIQLNTHLRLS